MGGSGKIWHAKWGARPKGVPTLLILTFPHQNISVYAVPAAIRQTFTGRSIRHTPAVNAVKNLILGMF